MGIGSWSCRATTHRRVGVGFPVAVIEGGLEAVCEWSRTGSSNRERRRQKPVGEGGTIQVWVYWIGVFWGGLNALDEVFMHDAKYPGVFRAASGALRWHAQQSGTAHQDNRPWIKVEMIDRTSDERRDARNKRDQSSNQSSDERLSVLVPRYSVH